MATAKEKLARLFDEAGVQYEDLDEVKLAVEEVRKNLPADAASWVAGRDASLHVPTFVWEPMSVEEIRSEVQ